jgi:hypothetical protein
MSTTTEPRFARESARGREHELTEPLPSTLAGLPEVRARAQQHGKVAGRLFELRARLVELSRELARSEATDEENAVKAALAGKSPPRRQKTARLRNLLEECESEVASFEDAVGKSADGLLAVAAPFRELADEKASEAHAAAIARGKELLNAADAAFAEAGALVAERSWLAGLDVPAQAVEPFRSGTSGDHSLSRLRSALQNDLAEWEARDERLRAELDRQRSWQEEHRDEWERQRVAAEREDRERRVRYEGMRLTHRGGRPVGPAADFQDEEEER